MVIINSKSSLMSQLALSALFEYLCDGRTAIRNTFYSYIAGIDFIRQNLTHRLWTSESDAC